MCVVRFAERLLRVLRWVDGCVGGWGGGEVRGVTVESPPAALLNLASY